MTQPDNTMQYDIRAAQRLRLRRFGMAFCSYLVQVAVVVFCWYQSMLSSAVMLGNIGLILGINLALLLTFLSGLNLRFREPSLAFTQITVSLIPALFTMYFLDAGQARAVFLLLSIVPPLYGIYVLDIRQFSLLGSCYIAMYAVFVVLMYQTRASVMDDRLELIQFIGLVLVVTETALIGAHISRLRQKLRNRNQKLKVTTAELNGALSRIQILMRKDPVTGAYNRRHMLDVLDQESTRSRRTGTPLSICMIDIDFFKLVNDEYGHLAGDSVLNSIVECINTNIRATDCLARYGGEEFLLILPETAFDDAITRAERLCAEVAAMHFPDVDNRMQITVSIGVTTCLDDDDVNQLIHRSDQALYRAKNAGRDCVVAMAHADAEPDVRAGRAG